MFAYYLSNIIIIYINNSRKVDKQDKMTPLIVGTKIIQFTPYIPTITATIQSIMSMSASSDENSKMCEFLDVTDIQVKIDVYSSLLKELPYVESETVLVCIKNINAVIKEIEEKLILVQTKITYNCTIWFKRFRSYSFKDDIAKLTILIKKLDVRIMELKITYEFSQQKINDPNQKFKPQIFDVETFKKEHESIKEAEKNTSTDELTDEGVII